MSALNTDSNIFYKVTQPQPAIASSLTLKRTKWLFFALCCYLLAQCFTIPILAIGPSWAIWLNLSDLATGLLVLTFLLSNRHTIAPSKANWNIFCILILICLGCIMSYTWHITWQSSESAKGSSFGIFQIYRLIQFMCIFWVTAHTPLTTERINVLKRIVEAVLIFVCVGIVLTYFSVLPLSTLTAHLPQGVGPWSSYANIESIGGKGWGTIGYNHAYVSVQVIMLASLKIHLSLNKKVLLDNILLILSIIACFLSESRAGLATILIFAMIYWFQKPIYALLAIVIAVVIGTIAIVIGSQSINLTSAEGSTIERQAAIFDAKNSENLSGRDEIWKERMALLNNEPILWFFGSGFGSAVDSGNNAHMLYLQIILETGLVGLLIFAWLFYRIIYYLYKYEQGLKPIFWVTVAFLVSSLTQETFYPTPAFGHFIGFYLCSVAIALRREPLI